MQTGPPPIFAFIRLTSMIGISTSAEGQHVAGFGLAMADKLSNPKQPRSENCFLASDQIMIFPTSSSVTWSLGD